MTGCCFRINLIQLAVFRKCTCQKSIDHDSVTSDTLGKWHLIFFFQGPVKSRRSLANMVDALVLPPCEQNGFSVPPAKREPRQGSQEVTEGLAAGAPQVL